MAVNKDEIAANIYARLVANYPHIHQKIGPDGKPSQELDHVLKMITNAAIAAAGKFVEMTGE